jgi:hypothetical protein
MSGVAPLVIVIEGRGKGSIYIYTKICSCVNVNKSKRGIGRWLRPIAAAHGLLARAVGACTLYAVRCAPEPGTGKCSPPRPHASKGLARAREGSKGGSDIARARLPPTRPAPAPTTPTPTPTFPTGKKVVVRVRGATRCRCRCAVPKCLAQLGPNASPHKATLHGDLPLRVTSTSCVYVSGMWSI